MQVEAMIEMRDKGLTYKEIAVQAGITANTVRYHIHKFKRQNILRDNPFEFETLPIYERNRILLLVKDTHTLYTYWDISKNRKRMIEVFFNQAWEELPKLLRVYDVTLINFDGSNFNRDWLIPVHEHADNWFIHDIQQKCNYVVDYGARTQCGKFFSFLRSNTVRVGSYEESVPYHQDRSVNEGIPSSWEQQFNGYSISERVTQKESEGL